MIALGQDRLGGRRQLIPGGPVLAGGTQDLAALEPGDRRADRGLVDARSASRLTSEATDIQPPWAREYRP